MGGCPWSATADGLLLTVRLTPKGGRDSIDGTVSLADGQAVLKARVRAAPNDGEANAALVALLAKTLRVAPGQVTIVGGASARIKRIRIAGDGTILAAVLEKVAASR